MEFIRANTSRCKSAFVKLSVLNKLIFLVAILYFSFIFWIIVEADKGVPNFFIDNVEAIPYGDKLGHLMIYGVLSLLMNLILQRFTFRFCALPVGSFLVLMFALAEELSQGFFPSRTLDIGDVIADVIGVYVAAFISARLIVRSS